MLHKRSKQKCCDRREDEQSRCNDQEGKVDKMEQVIILLVKLTW